jgi:plasmid replication initiation protein
MVVVHNDFNNVNLTRLKEKELDLLISLCYKLRDEGVEEVKLSFEELKKLSQYEDRHIERFVKDLDSVYKKLIELNFRYEDENKIIRFVLFKSYEIDKNNKTVTIAVNEKFKYILNQLTGNFTRFELNQFVSLNSQYAKHIFRFLKQFNGTGWREFLLSDFRELLNIPEKYRISEIDKYVLNEKILKELEKSFKNLKVFKLKNGRSVYKIRFEWEVEKKKEKEEVEVLPKTEKEKNTDKLIKKQAEDIELAEIINKETNEKYNNYLKLSEEIKIKIEKIIYFKFLEESKGTDNKTMRGIFEKSKKSLIVREYEEILEEIEKEKILEEQEPIQTDEKILEEPKQTLEKFEEENPIGWEQKTFIIEPKTEVELEVEKIIKTMFPFLEDELLNSDDIDYIKTTLRRKKMYKEIEIFDLFIENKQTTVVDPINIFKDEKCLGLSEVGKDYIENYIKENQLEHLLISEKTKKELKGSARENRLIKLYKNNLIKI